MKQSGHAARITRIGTLQGGPAASRLPLPRTKSNASRLPLVGLVAGVGRLPCCRLAACETWACASQQCGRQPIRRTRSRACRWCWCAATGSGPSARGHAGRPWSRSRGKLAAGCKPVPPIHHSPFTVYPFCSPLAGAFAGRELPLTDTAREDPRREGCHAACLAGATVRALAANDPHQAEGGQPGHNTTPMCRPETRPPLRRTHPRHPTPGSTFCRFASGCDLKTPGTPGTTGRNRPKSLS